MVTESVWMCVCVCVLGGGEGGRTERWPELKFYSCELKGSQENYGLEWSFEHFNAYMSLALLPNFKAVVIKHIVQLQAVVTLLC